MVPAVFRRVDMLGGWQDGTTNLDYGGGPYDKMTVTLAGVGVDNLVFDVYNRSIAHNMETIKRCERQPADTVTISNVLNVIRNRDERIKVLKNCKRLLKKGGKVYLTVYEKDGSGKGRQTRDGWQEQRRLISYRKEVTEVFNNIEMKNRMMICS
jgi:SAM-dependent methyltransferase